MAALDHHEVPMRVATFNLWGIFNSKMREARMKVFASKIQNYDIILLQEQFSPDDFELIRRSATHDVQNTYQFRRFRSSFYGSGCAVISRYPIKQAFFHTYPLQGYPEMVLHGDFFANKGAAMLRVQVPVPSNDGSGDTLQEVIFYTTHLVAIYQKVSQLSSWKKERYLPYRISQAISFANLILSTSRPTDRIIIGGDFNCSQRSLEVQLMLLLLKQHGYDMRSVLPSPRTLLDSAATEAERDQGLRLFTFSNRNAFNMMKTSYFKLLKLEADIPSQIDHIFFSRPAFKLRDFSSCPDVDSAYPTKIRNEPNGLVIFTKDEVHVPPQPSWWGSIWHSLVTGKTVQDTRKYLYPLSDHYGVAAMLGMRIDEVNSTSSPVTLSAAAAAAAPSPRLTNDEVQVLTTVTEFLEDHVGTLRSQIRTTRYMAVTSIVAVAVNLLVLRRLNAQEESRTAAALEQMYELAAATTTEAVRGTKSKVSLPSMGQVKDKVTGAGGWVARKLHLSKPAMLGLPAGSAPAAADMQRKPPTADAAAVLEKDAAKALAETPGTPEPAESPHFVDIAAALAMRPLWASTWVSSALNIGAAVIGTASFAIGMFQRAGNANILEEQVQQLRLLQED